MMTISRHFASHVVGLEAVTDTLQRNFDGNYVEFPQVKKLVEMLGKEPGNEGSEALEKISSELSIIRSRNGISVTPNIENLDQYVFSTLFNPPTLSELYDNINAMLDQCNPEAHPNGEAANPRLSSRVTSTLKVKVFMGAGWKVDFRHLDLCSPPDLYVKVGIVGGNEMKTKTKKNEWEPTWEEEFLFTLADRGAADLSIKVYDHDTCTKDDFAGETTLKVSQLHQGIRCVPLYFCGGKKCSSTWLLMRFVLV